MIMKQFILISPFGFAATANESIRERLLANPPIGRAAQPDEMADMVLILCSDSGFFTAGQGLVVMEDIPLIEHC